jgi:hypothetical protein
MPVDKPHVKLKLQESDTAALEMRRQVKGALKSCIADHGPITKPLIGSVLKRLEAQPVYRRLMDGKR